MWRPDGVFCRSLKGHGHWVNALALNTQYVIRTGAFEPAEATQSNALSKEDKGMAIEYLIDMSHV